MAEIPVERKSGMPWWVWLLAALLLIGLIWWIADSADEPEVAMVAPPAVAPLDPVAPAPGTEITDPLVIVAVPVPERPSLIGRTVRLTDVQVQDVIGDQAFWIGPSADQRVLVSMMEVPPPGSPTDADIDINPGQTINLIGEVRALPALTGMAEADRTAMETAFGPAFAAAAQNEPIYIFARAADIVARP